MHDPYTKEEEYIVDESPEIVLGENPGWLGKLKGTFPAFKHKNYRLYFGGQLTSLVGTWLQNVALGWLVLQITHSAFWVGSITALENLPILFFSLFGGVIVDRLPKKKIVIFTQTSAMLLAFIMGFLTLTHKINLLEIGFLGIALGMVEALDFPARQSFIIELVGKEDLPSAISLNSATFNGARVVGPAIAGALIALIGTGGAFTANGISFVAVIIALFFIKVEPVSTSPSRLHPIESIKAGLSYSFSNKTIRTLLLLATVTSIFGWSFTTIMPVIAEDVYHIGAAGLGYLNTAVGLGALTATILISALSKKVSPLFFILGGNALFAVSLILFSLIHFLPLALLLLYFSGVGLLSQFATINTTIQRLVPDDFRGRVMSIYTLMFVGMIPFGSFEIGAISEKFGPLFAIALGSMIVFFAGGIVFSKRKKLLSV